MKLSRKTRTFFSICVCIFAIESATKNCPAQFSGAPSASSALSIPQADLIQPETLNKALQESTGARPRVLQVGSHVMFLQAHIPGSKYAGPGSQPEGLKLLEEAAATTQKDSLMVLYCGCCPWNRCPNVGPAYKRLRDLGYTQVKVLYIANNFGADWVNMGYNVEHGE